MQNNSKDIFSHRVFNEIINKSKRPIQKDEEREDLTEERFYGKARLLTIQDIQQNINLRRQYSDKIYTLNRYWLVFVAVMVLLSIIDLSAYKIKITSLSDAVLITLLTTTTANIIGTLIIVLKYLFPNKK